MSIHHYQLLSSPEDTRLTSPAMVTLGVGVTSLVLLGCLFNDYLLNYPQDTQFQIESAAVSGLNVSSDLSYLSGTWDITLLVTNPNHKGTVTCNSLQASLYRTYQPWLATNDAPPFFVDTANNTRVNLKFGLVSRYIGHEVADEISQEIATRGTVSFGLMMEVRFTYRTKIWDKWDGQDSGLLELQCHPIQFRFSPNNNTFTANSTICREG